MSVQDTCNYGPPFVRVTCTSREEGGGGGLIDLLFSSVRHPSREGRRRSTCLFFLSPPSVTRGEIVTSLSSFSSVCLRLLRKGRREEKSPSFFSLPSVIARREGEEKSPSFFFNFSLLLRAGRGRKNRHLSFIIVVDLLLYVIQWREGRRRRRIRQVFFPLPSVIA